MKKLLMMFGAVFILILGLVALLVLRGTVADRESKAYADASVISIVSAWNEQALIDRASPEFIHNASKAQIDALFARLRPLGHMTRYAGSSGSSFINFNVGTGSKGSTTTAVYIANADFEHGSAQIKITLIKQHGAWRILGFFVQGNGASNFRTTLISMLVRPA
jgi:hypothetical protein